jgi:hypothetical protein
MALMDLPQGKWGGATGRQVILKRDFACVEQAVVEAFDLAGAPALVYVGPAHVQVEATDTCRARMMLNGFPSPLHRGLWVDAGLADGRYRESAGPVTLDLGSPDCRWGEEKPDQWYCVYALAAANEVLFSLKAMPVMRVATVQGQVIALRNNANTAGIGYGLAENELAQASLLVLTGDLRGQSRVITGNNADNGVAGSISYAGSALLLAPGDWFVVLPNTNFRSLGMIFNDANGNLAPFFQEGRRSFYQASRVLASGPLNGFTRIDLGLAAPPTARQLFGYAAALGGVDLKLAVSLDGSTLHLLLHGAPPASTLAGVRGAMPFACPVAAGHGLYLHNDNAGNQEVRITGWEE